MNLRQRHVACVLRKFTNINGGVGNFTAPRSSGTGFRLNPPHQRSITFAPARRLFTSGCREARCASKYRVIKGVMTRRPFISYPGLCAKCARRGRGRSLSITRTRFSTLHAPEEPSDQVSRPSEPAPPEDAASSLLNKWLEELIWKDVATCENTRSHRGLGSRRRVDTESRLADTHMRTLQLIGKLERLGLSVTLTESSNPNIDANTTSDEDTRIGASAVDTKRRQPVVTEMDLSVLSGLLPKYRMRYILAVLELRSQGFSVSVSQSRSTSSAETDSVTEKMDGHFKQLNELTSSLEQKTRRTRPDTFVFSESFQPFYSTSYFKNMDRYPPYSYKSRVNPAEVVYIRDHKRANVELPRLFEASHGGVLTPVVGFDVEWCPSDPQAGNRVDLVQIASASKILLLHLSEMKLFPKKLIGFLNDETILKAGVGILGDAQRMYRSYGVTVRSCVELSYLARALDHDRWSGRLTDLISLARLVYAYTGYSLAKGEFQRNSSWQGELTLEEMDYAANDAHASRTIAGRLLKRAQHIERSLFMFDVVRANAVSANGQSWDVRYPPPPPPRAQQLASLKEAFLRAELKSRSNMTLPKGLRLPNMGTGTSRNENPDAGSDARKAGNAKTEADSNAPSNTEAEGKSDPFGWEAAVRTVMRRACRW